MKSAIRLIGKRLVTSGDAPYDVIFDLKMADALLDDEKDRAIEIMTNLSARSSSQLMTTIRLDKQLKAKYDALVAYSKAKNKKPASQLFKPDDIIDEVVIFCPPISSIVFLVDGRRLIREDPEDITQTLTFDEYQKKYNETVETALERIYSQKLAVIERALYLTRAEPTTVSAVFADANLLYPPRDIVVYDHDQLGAYASRHNLDVIENVAKDSK